MVSTWMGDRLGTPCDVGISIFFSIYNKKYLLSIILKQHHLQQLSFSLHITKSMEYSGNCALDSLLEIRTK